jgi:hypothetical protein
MFSGVVRLVSPQALVISIDITMPSYVPESYVNLSAFSQQKGALLFSVVTRRR